MGFHAERQRAGASKWSYQQIAGPQPGRGDAGSAPEGMSQSQDRQTFDAILSRRLPELGVGTARRLCACLEGGRQPGAEDRAGKQEP